MEQEQEMQLYYVANDVANIYREVVLSDLIDIIEHHYPDVYHDLAMNIRKREACNGENNSGFSLSCMP